MSPNPLFKKTFIKTKINKEYCYLTYNCVRLNQNFGKSKFYLLLDTKIVMCTIDY